MDKLELEKARQLRKIAESREPAEPIADFNVKRFADGRFTVAAEGSLIEIAMMVAKGLHDIEMLDPAARMIFSMAFREYMEV